MPLLHSRVLRIEITFTLIVLPLLVWLALYLAHRWWNVNLRLALPWLKTLRWTGWGIGGVLLLLSLGGNNFLWFYGIATATFSAGFSFPVSWVKRRFPELVEPDRT